MAIQGIVFDVSGTLLEMTAVPRPATTTTPQPGVVEMLTQLKEMGLTIIAASNDAVYIKLKDAGLLQYIDHVVERKDVGIAKRSPRWVQKFVELTGLQPNQFFYVGDSDNDMITATWGPVIYAHAMWSCAPGVYGLQALSPAWVVNLIRHIFMKQHPWYWTLDTTDDQGRPVRMMTLLDADGAGHDKTKSALLRLLKDDIDTTLRGTPMTLRQIVMLHMLASLYHENLFGGAGIWTTYPGHTGELNAVMGDFLDVAAKLSRNKYKSDLLVRHTPAMRSRVARGNGDTVRALRNQLETMQVGREYRSSIVGKRILLLDNFLTWGYTTEGGRTLLLQAGASEVIVACVAKYGPRVNVITPPADEWDAFEVARPDATRFSQTERRGTYHEDALTDFLGSLRGLSVATW